MTRNLFDCRECPVVSHHAGRRSCSGHTPRCLFSVTVARRLQHGQRRVGLVEHVEVDARHTLLDQLADLSRGELDTDLVLPVGIVVGRQLCDKLGRQRCAAHGRKPLDL